MDIPAPNKKKDNPLNAILLKDTKLNTATKNSPNSQFSIPESEQYILIGNDIFRKTYTPTNYGDSELELDWCRRSSLDLHHSKKISATIIDEMDKFIGLCNIADHLNYQQIIHSKNSAFYNLYHELPYKPLAGGWANTENFLRHIFQNKFQDKYDLMLDYLTLIYRNPKQKLPIIVLISQTRETGKTSFLNWLRKIYSRNAVIINNDIINSRFNYSYVSKLVIGLDEGKIPLPTVEKLKTWSTADKLQREGKGTNPTEIDFIGKIIITTNHFDFAHIDSDEIRFLVCEVDAILKKDPNLIPKLEAEIPAFLYYLKHRELFTDEPKTRHWFAPDQLDTPALHTVRKSTSSTLQKDLISLIQETILEAGLWEYRATFSDLFHNIKIKSNRKFTNEADFKAELIAIGYLSEHTKPLDRMVLLWRGDPPILNFESPTPSRGRCYQFYADKILSAQQLKELITEAQNPDTLYLSKNKRDILDAAKQSNKASQFLNSE